MCVFSTPDIPAPAPVEEQEPLPTAADPAVQRARTDAKRRTALAGRNPNIYTAPGGLINTGPTAQKTLLGT